MFNFAIYTLYVFNKTLQVRVQELHGGGGGRGGGQNILSIKHGALGGAGKFLK